MTANWYFEELPALCAFSALLELDDAKIGQWLLSRPIVVGAALGIVTGAPGRASILGALMELITLDDLPLGHRIPINGTIATAAAVLLCSGRSGLDISAAFALGLASGLLFRSVENWARARRATEAERVDAYLSAGRRIPFGRIFLKSILIQFALVASFLYLVAAGAGPAAGAGWTQAPAWFRSGAEKAFLAAPWLGLATALRLLRPR